MRILVVNGPNMNMLGRREPSIYGSDTYKDLVGRIKSAFPKKSVKFGFVQSNYEGKIVSVLQSAYKKYDGIVLNAGAYTHTSIAILDALKCSGLPCAEVHISDPSLRENFRRISYVSEYAFITVKGKGFDGYIEAVEALLTYKNIASLPENDLQ